MPRVFNPAEPELMDRPQPVTAEFERDLENLRKLNRYFGSYALIRQFISRWIKPGDEMRVLDLATGSGDIPRLIVDHAREVDARVAVEALDQNRSTIEIARRLSSDYPEVTFTAADLLEWAPPRTYDIVLCTLALHHFADDDAVRVLRRCRELSRRFVLVSDLRRSAVANVGVFLLTATIFRDPMTKVDGRLSAARAFSFEELGELARRAGWKGFGQARFRWARQAVWLE